MKCKICGKEFELREEDRYFVINNSVIFQQKKLGEAFDCPYCGCQNVVNKRYKTKRTRFVPNCKCEAIQAERTDDEGDGNAISIYTIDEAITEKLGEMAGKE